MPTLRATLLLALAVLAVSCTKSDARNRGDAGNAPRAGRAPEEVRVTGNGLAASSSQYLREHGHDPVDWQPWTDATIARAAAEDKPIFLSIGYSSCHWCHVMHDEVFAKDDVARVLNERFIAIKVDREERPDLDATYIAALTRIAGSAGWPASLFLTPGLDPFFGATYVKHDAFLDAAARSADAYAQREAGTVHTVSVHERPVDPSLDSRLTAGTAVRDEEIRGMAEDVVADMDLVRGGMKGAAKFPMAPRLAFLLHAVRKWELPALAAALRTTLDAMASGALRDPVSGAFHRYTTDPNWAVPHYEVMLYDLAQLAALYLEAASVLDDARYLVVAREALDFLIDDLRVPSGAFAASLDADTGGEEGAAWRWSANEVAAITGSDGPIAAALLGVSNAKIAPMRRVPVTQVAAKAGVSEAAVESAWTRARPLLRAARAKVARRDDKVVAAWNGLAVDALARGYLATRDPRYREAAVTAADAVWREQREGLKRLTRTPGGADAFAADYGDLCAGYLSLFEATSDARWLNRAESLVLEAAVLAAPEGGYQDGSGTLARAVALDDHVEPSGTAAMLRVLVRRGALRPTGDDRADVSRVLARYGNAMRARHVGAATWLDAALLHAGPVYQVVIAGDDKDAASLLAVHARALPPWSVLVRTPGDGASADLRATLPSLVDKTAGKARARAFVCDRTACKAPATTASALREELIDGWKR